MSAPNDLSTLRRSPATEIAPPRRSLVSRVALPAVLLAAFAGLLAWVGRESLRPKLDVRLVPVVVRSGTGTSGTTVARAAGWVEPEPFAVEVPALTEGVVAEVLVLEGDRVEKDQVVAKLIPDDATIAADAARAALAAAKAREAGAEAAARTVRDSVAYELRRDEDRARAAVAEADAGVREAEGEALAAQRMADAEAARQRRAEADLAHGLVSSNEADEMRRRAEAARSAASAADAKVAASSERLAAARADEAAVASRRAVEDGTAGGATRADLALGPTCAAAQAAWEDARAETLRMAAEVAAAELRVRRLEVRSPSAGLVLERRAAAGSRAGPDMPPVVTLYDPGSLRVRVDIPLADAAKVGLGQKARVTVEALPGRTFEGTVTRVVELADVQKNTVQVKVALAAPDPVLRPEMLARAEFEGAAPAAGAAPGAPQSARTVWAPERLLGRSGPADHATAWVAEDGRAAERHLRLGGGRETADGETWVEVLEGLRAGDDLIDADPSRLSEGRAVRAAGGVR